MVRHVDAPPAEPDHRFDVGSQGIADYRESRRVRVAVVDDPRVGLRILFGNDLDAMEEAAAAALIDLAFLVEEDALGHPHDAVLCCDGFLNAWQQFHRVSEHRFGERNDLMQVLRADRAIGQLNRSFDHRQRHALCAAAEQRQVCTLYRAQATANRRITDVDPAAEDAFELRADMLVVIFATPESVISIETDQLDHRIPFCCRTSMIEESSLASGAVKL